jgi:hypothetical protein
MIQTRRRLARRILPLVLLTLIASGSGPCSNSQQPKTVADILVAAGSVKRDFRARGELTPQQDYDLSAKLLAANVAYKQFITDEVARLDAGTPDPSARQAAIRALITSLRGIQDPSVIGFKSSVAQKSWREAIAGLNTIISGLEALQGGE